MGAELWNAVYWRWCSGRTRPHRSCIYMHVQNLRRGAEELAQFHFQRWVEVVHLPVTSVPEAEKGDTSEKLTIDWISELWFIARDPASVKKTKNSTTTSNALVNMVHTTNMSMHIFYMHEEAQLLTQHSGSRSKADFCKLEDSLFYIMSSSLPWATQWEQVSKKSIYIFKCSHGEERTCCRGQLIPTLSSELELNQLQWQGPSPAEVSFSFFLFPLFFFSSLPGTHYYKPGQPSTHKDLPTSTSQELVIKGVHHHEVQP